MLLCLNMALLSIEEVLDDDGGDEVETSVTNKRSEDGDSRNHVEMEGSRE